MPSNKVDQQITHVRQRVEPRGRIFISLAFAFVSTGLDDRFPRNAHFARERNPKILQTNGQKSGRRFVWSLFAAHFRSQRCSRVAAYAFFFAWLILFTLFVISRELQTFINTYTKKRGAESDSSCEASLLGRFVCATVHGIESEKVIKSCLRAGLAFRSAIRLRVGPFQAQEMRTHRNGVANLLRSLCVYCTCNRATTQNSRHASNGARAHTRPGQFANATNARVKEKLRWIFRRCSGT